MRGWIPVLAVVALNGCYLLVEDGGEKSMPTPIPTPEPYPVPVEVPVPTPVPVPPPPVLENGGVGVLWLFRVDANTANLADGYARMIAQVDAALLARGIPIASQAVGSLYDGRLLWGRTATVAAPVPVEVALRYYGALPPPHTYACTTDSLAYLGMDLSSQEVRYSEDLLDDGHPSAEVEGGEASPIAVKHSLHPFASSPAALVVVLVDSGERPSALTDPSCARGGMNPSVWFGGTSPVTWLRFDDGRQLLREQTRFALVATPEGVDAATMRQQCAAVQTFPRAALDVIAPSEKRFFDRFDEDLRPLTERFDFCQAVGGQWDPGAFADRFIETLQQLRPIGR